MSILNYTTTIAVEKTMGEIQGMLAKAGASAVLAEYEEGIVVRLSFKAKTPHGMVAFCLPANIDGVYKSLYKSPKATAKLRTREQAARVAWRIVKDWVEAQLAIIEAGMALLTQVFLPYAQTDNGQTVYERFESGGLPLLSSEEAGR